MACIDKKIAKRVLLGKLDVNRPLGKLRHRQENEIKIYLKVIG